MFCKSYLIFQNHCLINLNHYNDLTELNDWTIVSGSPIVLPNDWKECDIYFGNVYIARVHKGFFLATKDLYNGYYRDSNTFCFASVNFDGVNTFKKNSYKANTIDYTSQMILAIHYR